MEINDIRQLAELMKENQLTSLEFSDGGERIRMERGGKLAAFRDEPAADTDEIVPDDGLYTVASPMVGVFYASPGTNIRPFVSVGDTVKAGDVLCLIEAMKMMNEITSDRDGVVAEICVEDRQTVDYGRALFKLRCAPKDSRKAVK